LSMTRCEPTCSASGYLFDSVSTLEFDVLIASLAPREARSGAQTPGFEICSKLTLSRDSLYDTKTYKIIKTSVSASDSNPYRPPLTGLPVGTAQVVYFRVAFLAVLTVANAIGYSSSLLNRL